MSAATRPTRAGGYVPPEHSEDPVRTGTLFPVVLARWRHWTTGCSFEQLVAHAGNCFAEALEGKEPDNPQQLGPADVAAVLTIIDERRRALRHAEQRALAGLIEGPDVHEVEKSVEKPA